jgi:hypothetical protein
MQFFQRSHLFCQADQPLHGTKTSADLLGAGNAFVHFHQRFDA